MTLGALAGPLPQPFEPAAMLERYPMRLITLDERIRARYGVPQH